MFFILSKVLSFLLMPLTWIVTAFLIALLSKVQKRKKIFLRIGVGLLLLLTNHFIINEILNIWEIPPVEIETMPDYDIGIILTGVTKGDKSPRDRVYYNKGADRVLHPLQLFRQGKIKRFLISGGSGLLVNRKKDVEAENLKQTLLFAGVPDSLITIEGQSKNTHENAVNSAVILKDKFPRQTYLLITSAFHMRRSLACFKNAGVAVIPFSVDFYSEDRKFTSDSLVPSVDTLAAWHILFKEWFGIIVYKGAGYI